MGVRGHGTGKRGYQVLSSWVVGGGIGPVVEEGVAVGLSGVMSDEWVLLLRVFFVCVV